MLFAAYGEKAGEHPLERATIADILLLIDKFYRAKRAEDAIHNKKLFY
ncbi:hypothetical protein [Erwinia sp.]|nr:hypothetical protein [Erwinia sp.]